MKSSRSLSTLLTLGAFAIGATCATAQDRSGRPDAAPRLTEEFEFSLGGSASGGVERGGAELGDVSVTSFSGGLRTFRPLDQRGRGLILGVEWTEHQLDVDAGVPLPDQLREIQLVLGLNQPINERWTAGIYARPGLASDFDSISGDDINLPVLLTLTYVRNPQLMWLFGVNVDPFSEYVVLPAVGVRWNFAPDWTFSLGFPRTGIAYAATDRLTLHAGAAVAGGNFHVGEDLPPGLRETTLSYREIRLGVSAEYQLRPNLGIELELGSTVDREFDYFDRDYDLDGDNVGYARLSISGKF